MRSLEQLSERLRSLEGRSYPAYKQVRGHWGDDLSELSLDHVQGDPFASPSRVRIRLPEQTHGIPADLRSERARRTGVCDFVLREFGRRVAGAQTRSGSGKSGQIVVDVGGAEILARSGCEFVGEALELRFFVGLPARGRRILGASAAELLATVLPRFALETVRELSMADARSWALLAEDHRALQTRLSDLGWVAFVADGSVLPRASGVSSRPLPDAVPFESPASWRAEVQTLHHGRIVGMAVPKGVTVITGGGFHGKTTVLEAIAEGIYPHVPGDGREWVVSDDDTVKVRSEDGRSISAVDLRPFIDALPGRSSPVVSTSDGSGSTSLAAAILESVEVGARALLLDEDTSATNLLVRDARMQALVRRETITPLVDCVQGFWQENGLSTVLVVGGSGDILDVADHVLLMEDYRAFDVTARAREVTQALPSTRAVARPTTRLSPRPRSVDLTDLPTRERGGGRARTRGLRELQMGGEEVDLDGLEQLVDRSQARAVLALLEWLARTQPRVAMMADVSEAVERTLAETGLYEISARGDLAAVRGVELAAVLNRMRGLRIEPTTARS